MDKNRLEGELMRVSDSKQHAQAALSTYKKFWVATAGSYITLLHSSDFYIILFLSQGVREASE